MEIGEKEEGHSGYCDPGMLESSKSNTIVLLLSQASVRGYLLRERLRYILKEAQSSDHEEEMEERGVDELLSTVIDEVSIGTIQSD